MLKLDIFPHIFPQPYFERMQDIAKSNPALAASIKRWMNVPVLWDLEKRMKMMKRFPDYKQILTLSMPSIEFLANENESPELARLANDGMAEIVAKHPDQFPAFVASLPMNNVPAALEEMDRAIGELGAKGIQIVSSVAGRPLDDPEFFPVLERVTNHHDMPIWMHPARPASRADYPGEPKSKYEIWQVLGWPFETSVAMARIVFSGLLQRLPKMRIITHHCGGMIPYFAGRAETLWAQLGSRSAEGDEADVLKKLQKPPIEYFKMFYGDTVLGGAAAPLACGLAFFGADRVVFASDCPFDPEGGPMFIREGIRSIEDLKLPEVDRRKIYFGNALRLLRMEGKL
jgi:aminocarboxymuconate-semialdehyde decarboxylase